MRGPGTHRGGGPLPAGCEPEQRKGNSILERKNNHNHANSHKGTEAPTEISAAVGGRGVNGGHGVDGDAVRGDAACLLNRVPRYLDLCLAFGLENFRSRCIESPY